MSLTLCEICGSINSKLKRKKKIMFKIQKKIEDIKFITVNVYGTEMPVSENIVMASAAGWYVGKLCKDDGIVQPYDRFTDYFATAEEAQVVLDTPMEQGGFYE